MVAFSELDASGVPVATIAARFGVSERIVEQRLRLGNAAPALLDAYRAEAIDLETLKAFAVTTDHLVGRMHRDAHHVLGERDLARVGSRDRNGDGVLRTMVLLTRRLILR